MTVNASLWVSHLIGTYVHILGPNKQGIKNQRSKQRCVHEQISFPEYYFFSYALKILK